MTLHTIINSIFASVGQAVDATIDLRTAIVNLAYLLAAVLFIMGFKGLSHPRKAVRGNILGSIGMFIAVVVTLINKNIVSYEMILAGVVVGGLIGMILAVKIEMTSMPELVGLFNGLGGGASVMVAGAVLIESTLVGSASPSMQLMVATAASGLIGAVTFWGSLVEFGKLSGRITSNAILIPGRHVINIILTLAAIAVAVMIIRDPSNPYNYWILVGISSILGVMAVIPIGGADMPVVISLLNSYSGMAAAATGFVLSNTGLIIAGSLVGASGLILTRIMCIAMNRSLTNVIFGVLGPVEGAATADDIYAGKVKSTSGEEVAMILEDARRVVISPGYGLAVSQSQHQVRDLMNLLETAGVEVEFGIHPVAGRMPGHMNVLLAEADIPYDKLKDLDEINSTFAETDVAIVIGANDVVNPDARGETGPIAGMPILDVDKARTCIVIKRSLSPGFAGIPNPLFAMDNTLMLFGDGKKALLEMIAAIKEG